MMILNERGRMIAIGGNIRRKDVDRIEADFVDLVERLAPHLRLALDVAQKVGELHVEREAMLSGVARAASLFVLAEDETLVFANAAGLAQLGEGQIVQLKGRSRLALKDAVAGEAVRAALRRPAPARGLAMPLDSRAGRFDLRLVAVDAANLPTLASPLFGTGGLPVALLALSLRENGWDAVAVVLRRMGLTPAEIAVTSMLAEGLDVAAIAARRGSSQETVRNQIKAAMSKTGSRRQVELVTRVLGLLRQGRDNG